MPSDKLTELGIKKSKSGIKGKNYMMEQRKKGNKRRTGLRRK